MLLLFLKCKFDHVSPLLKILHLLLITFGIKSNLFGMPHEVLCDLVPIYTLPSSIPLPSPDLTHHTLCLSAQSSLNKLCSPPLNICPYYSAWLELPHTPHFQTTPPPTRFPWSFWPFGPEHSRSPLGACGLELHVCSHICHSTYHTAEQLSLSDCQSTVSWSQELHLLSLDP